MNVRTWASVIKESRASGTHGMTMIPQDQQAAMFNSGGHVTRKITRPRQELSTIRQWVALMVGAHARGEVYKYVRDRDNQDA